MLRSPIKPITKRSRQQTLKSSTTSVTLPLSLRPTKPTPTSTPTAFNNSQVDESESEEENTIAQVISESESEKENQDLKELGPDRLDKEDTDESDIKKEVTEEFKSSKYFRQSIIDLKAPKGSHKSKLAPLKDKGRSTRKRARRT
ncbi:hypothetical protein DL98DRAFT_542102 [Cadophora sp. DSE1049]|nr:hypothetical protein DL98DRAFT_542102 [Cadophora sp. DSE1049]